MSREGLLAMATGWASAVRRRGLAGAAGALLLAGCGSSIDPWAPETVAQERIGYTPGASTIFCYATLAEGDCYDEPQPGPPNRFVSGYVYD